MNTLRLRFLTLFFGSLFLSAASAEGGVHVAYSESLQNFELNRTATANAQKPGMDPAQSLRFDAFSKRFDIRLQSNRSLLSSAQREALHESIGIYRGAIDGVAGSWVRLVVVEGLPHGMVWDGQEMYAIDVGSNGAARMYRLDDLQIPPGTLSCSHVGSSKNAGSLLAAVTGELSAAVSSAAGATSQLDMAVIGDFEFSSAQGASAQADIIARMNNVDGIFSSQLGVQLNVSQIDIFTTSSDPFTDESDASLLIDEVSDFRNATPEQFANGLTHLFTGRVLDTTTVGIAFGAGLCSRRFGAGLTQSTNGLTTDSLVVAHEIGHNFGAPHDGTVGSACEAEPQTFIMAPSVNGNDQFSACSILQMQAEIATASCLSPMPGTDVAVVAGGQPGTALLGGPVTVTFAVNSIGTDNANNVNIDVTIPAAVTLNGISASAGSCSSGGGSASCSIGTIVAGSGVDVTIDVTASATGNADFVATTTATIDDNSNNNQSTFQLNIDPAVELVLTAAGMPQIDLDASTTIRPVVENRSILAATGVTLTVTPGAGLQIDSASWSPGSCSIAGGIVTCQAATLAAQSSNTVDLQITGTSEGRLSYAMSVSGNEADVDTANNDVSGQVNVGNVTVNDDSGGGALDWLTLLLLSFCWVGRYLRSFGVGRH